MYYVSAMSFKKKISYKYLKGLWRNIYQGYDMFMGLTVHHLNILITSHTKK